MPISTAGLPLGDLREKANKAAVDAQALHAANKDKWTPELETQFQAFVTEAKDYKIEIQKREAHETALSDARSIGEEFSRPVTSMPNAPSEGSRAEFKLVTEAFSALAKGGSRAVINFARRTGQDPKGLVDKCKQIHNEAQYQYILNDAQGFRQYCETQQHVAPREMHALLSSDNTLGGFLTTDDFQTEVIKAEADFAAIRPLARVQPTSRDTLVFPKVTPHSTDSRRTSGFAGRYVAQRNVTTSPPTQQNQPTFSEERIPVHNWEPLAVSISEDLLQDSVTNVEQLLAELIAETKSFDEDDSFLSGTGVGEPEGILSAGITTVQSGGATALTYNGIVDLMVAIPRQYRKRSRPMMHSATWGQLLKLNTGTGGVYIFPPNAPPITLFGNYQIEFHEGMTAPVAGAYTANDKVIIWGDFKRYIIAERAGIRIKRLDEVFAPNIGFLPMARIGGQVVLTQAFRVLNIGA